MLTKTPRNGKAGKRTPRVAELPKITTATDTRDDLAHAAQEARDEDYFIVDVDAHVNETAFWSEITDRIDNDVLRYIAQSFRDRGGSPPGLLNPNGPLYQDVAGRIPHQQSQAEPTPPRPASPGAAHPARHGVDGHRLHDRVSDPDALARHASAGRRRSGARQGL